MRRIPLVRPIQATACIGEVANALDVHRVQSWLGGALCCSLRRTAFPHSSSLPTLERLYVPGSAATSAPSSQTGTLRSRPLPSIQIRRLSNYQLAGRVRAGSSRAAGKLPEKLQRRSMLIRMRKTMPPIRQLFRRSSRQSLSRAARRPGVSRRACRRSPNRCCVQAINAAMPEDLRAGQALRYRWRLFTDTEQYQACASKRRFDRA